MEDLVVNPDYSIVTKLSNFVSEIKTTEWRKEDEKWFCSSNIQGPKTNELIDNYSACVVGLRDYIKKINYRSNYWIIRRY